MSLLDRISRVSFFLDKKTIKQSSGTAYAIRKNAPVAGLVSDNLYNSGAKEIAPAPANAMSIVRRSSVSGVSALTLGRLRTSLEGYRLGTSRGLCHYHRLARRERRLVGL